MSIASIRSIDFGSAERDVVLHVVAHRSGVQKLAGQPADLAQRLKGALGARSRAGEVVMTEAAASMARIVTCCGRSLRPSMHRHAVVRRSAL